MLLLTGVFATTGPASATSDVATAEMADGDGLKIGHIAIHINSIDLPEVGQSCPTDSYGSWACGTEATNYLRDSAAERTISCAAMDRDRYGRIVAR